MRILGDEKGLNLRRDGVAPYIRWLRGSMRETPRTEELVCRDCARAHSVEIAHHTWPSDAMHDIQGFVVERVQVTFRGRCPECAAVRGLTKHQAG
jgi:hypothetical protein